MATVITIHEISAAEDTMISQIIWGCTINNDFTNVYTVTDGAVAGVSVKCFDISGNQLWRASDVSCDYFNLEIPTRMVIGGSIMAMYMDAGHGVFWVMDTNSGTIRAVVNPDDPAVTIHPAISPNGSSIVVHYNTTSQFTDDAPYAIVYDSSGIITTGSTNIVSGSHALSGISIRNNGKIFPTCLSAGTSSDDYDLVVNDATDGSVLISSIVDPTEVSDTLTNGTQNTISVAGSTSSNEIYITSYLGGSIIG